MDILTGLLLNVLEEGLIYGVMAMGVYITYQVLDFPDLSVDGTFPLGACVTGAVIVAGGSPWVACAAAFVFGALAGCVTGFLHVRLKITDLLSGILVMTGLSGSAVLPFYNQPTIFNSGPAALLPTGASDFQVVLVALAAAALVKILLDLYLKTKSGLLLRAAGNNPQYVISLGQDPGRSGTAAPRSPAPFWRSRAAPPTFTAAPAWWSWRWPR